MKINVTEYNAQNVDYSSPEIKVQTEEFPTDPLLKNERGQEQDMAALSEKSVINSIENANKVIISHNTRAEISIHEKTKDIMVKIVDTETNEVLREFPPEKILDLVAKMIDLAGIFVDKRR